MAKDRRNVGHTASNGVARLLDDLIELSRDADEMVCAGCLRRVKCLLDDLCVECLHHSLHAQHIGDWSP
ncbi:MAG: hypothetical protein DMF99_32100 [Acidobacteria bacterium]|nr:MAG: hypothetical protein DMF99_32100 [Acidobacteriota bacterium]